MKARLGVAALDAFGEFTRAELAALAGLLTYVEITQVGRAPLLRPPRKESAGSLLIIDAATRANLELMRSNQGSRAGSLLAAIDRTVTAAGARELASRLGSPLTDPAAVNARLDAVAYLADEPRLRQSLREELKQLPILPARWRGWRLGAAVRAISARSARRSARRTPLRASLVRAGWRARPAAASLPASGERLEAAPRAGRAVSRGGARRDASRQCARRRLHHGRRRRRSRRASALARRQPPGHRRACKRLTPRRPASSR